MICGEIFTKLTEILVFNKIKTSFLYQIRSQIQDKMWRDEVEIFLRF